MRVYLKEDHSWPLVSIQTWLRAGSIDEEESQAGISHALEHMVFKGTDRHAASGISRWMESLGGSLNAETSREYTHYFVDLPSAGSREAISLLGEMMHRATFPPEEWQRERFVILEEMKRRNDDPDALLWDLLSQAIYSERRLSRPVIGTPETVKNLSREELAGYYHDRYNAARCILVAAGDLNPRKMLAWITTAFRGMPAGREVQRPQLAASRPAMRDLKIKKPVKQSYLALALPTPPSSSADHEALDLLATILGEGRSSRLVSSLREKKKIAWSIHAGNITHEGPGIFAIFAECDPQKRALLGREIGGHFSMLLRRPPARHEIERAKNIILNSWLQSFESYHNQASIIGLFAVEDRLDRLENYVDKIAGLTGSQLKPVINRYFHPDALSSAVVEN